MPSASRTGLLPLLSLRSLCHSAISRLPQWGSVSPHAANDEKRYRLYCFFWKLLSDVGLWQNEEYLRRKEGRTVIHDKREIIVVTVSTLYLPFSILTRRSGPGTQVMSSQQIV